MDNELVNEYSEILLHKLTKKFKTMSLTHLVKNKPYVWNNTNKLLYDGYAGIKTGITDIAGPCLSSMYFLL